MSQGTYKVIMLGSTGVGKTAIVDRISKSEFSDIHVPTVGAQYMSISIPVDDGKVSLEVWDTAGQEIFRSLVGYYARDAKGVFLVADITVIESIKQLEEWVEFINENANGAKLILFANKLDLINERKVSEEDLEEFAKANKAYYMEGSAKTGQNVSDAFSKMAEILKGNVEENENEEATKVKPKDQKSSCC